MASSSNKADRLSLKTECPYCTENFTVYVPSDINARFASAHCPRCAAEIRVVIPPSGNRNKNIPQEVDSYTVHVTGEVAKEVEDVAKSLLKEIEMSKNKRTSQQRNPWISGSFYLAGVVIIGTLILIIAQNVNVWVLPIVIIGTLLLVSIVGAFQLRQDSSLSQKNFLNLMLMTFRQIPFIQSKDKTPKK